MQTSNALDIRQTTFFSRICLQNVKALLKLVGMFLAVASPSYCAAGHNERVLTLHVTDVQGTELSGVRLGVRGERDTTETLEGSARIRLSPQTTIENWIRLTIVNPTDLIIVSPWDARVQLAKVDSGPQSRVSVVLAERGQKRSLEDPAIIGALLRRVNQAIVPQVLGAEESAAERHATALQKVARYFGLAPDEVEAAIHA